MHVLPARRAAIVLVALAVTAVVLPARPASAQEPGSLEVGAARMSMEPRPDDYGGTWETEGCETAGGDAGATADHVPDFRLSWAENSNCLYMGGFGIGPMNAITSFDDEYGLWVRALAIANGTDMVVLVVIDASYWLGDLNTMCTDCGGFELADHFAATYPELKPEGFIIHATHSHASPDFIGAWGGVPPWYFEQITDTIHDTVDAAVADLRPAEIEFGEELIRSFNRERRNTYRSAESETLSWLRAHDRLTNETIATVGVSAGHPTTHGTNDRVAHADWVGIFEKRLEERFGGLGMHFMSGLGNMSFADVRDENDERIGGALLADVIPDPGTHPRIGTASIGAARDQWNQPVTNIGLSGLGAGGFFDRAIRTGVFSSLVQKSEESEPCVSNSTLGIATQVSAFHVGPLVFTGGPGELFSNITNTFREKSPGAVTYPIAIANDGLGYIIQEFEFNRGSQTGVGFAGTDFFDYEDAYGIDACFGDEVTERTLRLMAAMEVDPAPAPPGATSGQPGDDGDGGSKPTPVTGGGVAVLVLAVAALAALGRARR